MIIRSLCLRKWELIYSEDRGIHCEFVRNGTTVETQFMNLIEVVSTKAIGTESVTLGRGVLIVSLESYGTKCSIFGNLETQKYNFQIVAGCGFQK